jgi:hypothetical protein
MVTTRVLVKSDTVWAICILTTIQPAGFTSDTSLKNLVREGITNLHGTAGSLIWRNGVKRSCLRVILGPMMKSRVTTGSMRA